MIQWHIELDHASSVLPLCRLRNILETWKGRSPCNVHKHSKHRRTPLYLLESAQGSVGPASQGRQHGGGQEGCTAGSVSPLPDKVGIPSPPCQRPGRSSAKEHWVQKIKKTLTKKTHTKKRGNELILN